MGGGREERDERGIVTMGVVERGSVTTERYHER